ncbi:MAG: TatD family hydrolase [Muribaculaceae bacterium]|nr:TatD family hydrolase [Muribaculaceae bacterium]
MNLPPIVDIHTHHPENGPGAIVSCSPDIFPQLEEKYPSSLFSIGIHPWATTDISSSDYEVLDACARSEKVIAIGETGLDTLRGAPVDVQEAVFRHHIELSEQLHKPLVIHCVKSWEKLMAMYKEYSPVQNWAIHGFRGKPELARQLASRGIYISLGEKFNQAILDVVPHELILSETDESIYLPSLPFDTTPAIARFLT